jgi:glycine/D-amino acid oxidase-like deaminating enzyme
MGANGQGDAHLNARTRRAHLEAMAREPLDVLVIGGGITGAGVALDAVTRGYRVGLVERADFASGTSSRSTKLLHGGIRYLPQFDIALVSEGLHERGRLLRSDKALWGLVSGELEEITKQYGDERRTVLKAGAELTYDAEAYVVHEDTTVVVTRDDPDRGQVAVELSQRPAPQ